MTQSKPLSIFALLPLFMVILLDVAGIILVMPVLTPLILSPESTLIPVGTPLFVRDFMYGLSLSLYPLLMFFSTPVLGDMSDKYGRKIILMVCLLGSAVSYFVAAAGIVANSLITVLISRAIAGLAAGTQPLASAAIIDISTPNNKTRNLAWVVFMCSIGFIIGPLLGGLTSEQSLSSWFGYKTPFILSGIVCLINAVFLQICFKETAPLKSSHTLSFSKGFKLFIAAFSSKKFCLLSTLYFCFILAWSLYYQCITWFFNVNFHYSAMKLGLFIGAIGIVFMATTSLLSKIISRWFPNELAAFAFFVFIMGLGNLGAALSQSEIAQWLWMVVIASSDVICYTLAMSIFSNTADKDSQGWIMGVTGSIGALTWTVGGLIAGPLGYLAIHIPLWTAGLLCMISFVLMTLFKRSHA